MGTQFCRALRTCCVSPPLEEPDRSQAARKSVSQSAVMLKLTTQEVGKVVALGVETEEPERGLGYGSVDLLPWQSWASGVRGWASV